MDYRTLKAQGNAHHKAQRYTEALVSYTAALQHAGSQDEAVLHNNMAACHLKLGHHQQACVEASLCLELCPREVGMFGRLDMCCLYLFLRTCNRNFLGSV